MTLLWTEADDVTSRWVGGDVPATTTQIEKLLEDAEDTILSEFGDLPTRLEEGTIPLARVRKVAARVVIRHLRNPNGIRQQQQGAGPFQQSTTFGGEEPGALYLTDADRNELGDNRVTQAFTIDALPDEARGRRWLTPDTWEPIR